MMLVDQRVAEFGLEFLFLVGAVGDGVLVNRFAILESCQQISAIWHALDRRKGSQRVIIRKRVGIEVRRKGAQVEIVGQ